jgi:hypothetical protein
MINIRPLRMEIEKIQVMENDWLVGGRFSTMNSSSGFKLITDYLLNEGVIERAD